MLFAIIAIIIILLPIGFLFRSSILYARDKDSIKQLCKMLFPEGDKQREIVLNEFAQLTNNHYNREDLLDYYLKIKGLQFIDLHANSNAMVRQYLMKPTKIRLKYIELVKFYERYLNYPQAIGENLIENAEEKN